MNWLHESAFDSGTYQNFVYFIIFSHFRLQLMFKSWTKHMESKYIL